MKAESKSFSFLNEIQTFEIPFFQRAYVWKKDNWEELLDDLKQVNRRHFLGSIILKKINDSSVFGATTRVSVIDGQQRLTTLSILLKAIYDTFSDEIKANVLDDARNALFYKRKKTDSTYHIKVKHSKVDRQDFEKVIGSVEANGITSIDYSEIANLDVDDDNSSHKILSCYKYFVDQLKTFSPDIVSDIFDNLLSENNKMIVVIALDEDDHEQQIFDTINSAGVRLTSTDIVKNALFQKALEFCTEEDVVEFYDSTWGNVFCKDEETLHYWGKKRTIGRIQRDNSEVLLQSVAIIEKIFDPSEHTLTDIPDLYKKYIEDMKEKEVKEFVQKIINYAQIYRDNVPELNKTTCYSYEDSAKRLFHILDVLGLTTFNPYILFLLKKYEKDEGALNQRMNELEKFIMRRMIAGESTKGYNKNCLEFIDDETKPCQMAELISNDEVFTGLSKIKNREATLILFWIELKRRFDSKKYDLKELKYDYTLEHIMPQKWEENWSDVPYVNAKGEKIDEAEGKVNRQKMVYSIGNMTLLTGKLNTSIQNNKFKVKMEGSPKRKGVKAYAELSITSIDIVENVYNAHKEWNEYQCLQRQVALTKEVLDIWGVDDGDFDEPESFNVIGVNVSKPLIRSVGAKGKKTNIILYKKDGSTIQHDSAKDTLVEAFEEILRSIDKKQMCEYAQKYLSVLDSEPLFKKGEHSSKYANSVPMGDGYYLNTHSSTETKKKQLEDLSDALNLGWRVEFLKKG
jgi:uncharacterized protein with ParB-like and HNH nuclease domain